MSRVPMLTASAPGKMFLIGEYAVIEGAPALLTAVNRRATVTLGASADDRWHFSAPNLNIHDLTLDANGRPDRALADTLHERLRVFEAIRAAVTANLNAALPALTVSIDTGDFAREGHKLGLGSSAAVAAALTRALLAWRNVHPKPRALARLAITAHRAAQGGTGSGGDVATAVYGGIISYTRDRAPRPLPWPPGLRAMAVVTGKGASTTDLVARVYAYGERAPQAFTADMRRLATLANRAADQLDRADCFLGLARDYFDALIALDRHADAGIVSPRHHQLSRLAARHGAVFKSSGAGGGDVGLLLATTDIDQAALRRDFDGAGADIIDLGLGAPGVTLDSEHGQPKTVR